MYITAFTPGTAPHLPEAKEAWLANEPYCLFQSSKAFRSAWLTDARTWQSASS